jgi:hypothetical protein
MKHRVFAQAAAEARVEIQELDAEVSRLTAKRASLQVLEALLRQALTVAPISTESISDVEGNNAAAPPETPVAERPSWAESLPEGDSDSIQKEESPTESPGGAPAETPADERPSLADLLSRERPYSLRKDGWPATSPIDPHEIRKRLL